MLNCKQEVTIIGAIPKPIGGVTVFIWRQLHFLKDIKFHLLDLNPSDEKYKIPDNVRLTQLSERKLLSAIKLFILFLKGIPAVHFHFSSCASVVIALFLLKRDGDRWILTLHNGNQQGLFSKRSTISRYCIKQAILKFDKTICLSDKQMKFMIDLGVSSNKLIRSDSYMPPPKQSDINKDLDAIKWVYKQKEEGRKVILSSGYGRQIYNFEIIMQGFRNNLRGEFALLLVLYGAEIHGRYIGEIKSLLSGVDSLDIKIVDAIDPMSFLELQSIVDAYVRLTTEDSFGISVADSIYMNKYTLATDVCTRVDGVDLISVSGIHNWSRHFLKNYSDQIPFQEASNDEIRNLYMHLYGSS